MQNQFREVLILYLHQSWRGKSPFSPKSSSWRVKPRFLKASGYATFDISVSDSGKLLNHFHTSSPEVAGQG